MNNILVIIIILIISIIWIFLYVEYFDSTVVCPSIPPILTCGDPTFISTRDISNPQAQQCIPQNFIHYNNKICSCGPKKKLSLERNGKNTNLAICNNGLPAEAKKLTGYLPWKCNTTIPKYVKIAKNIGSTDFINLYCR